MADSSGANENAPTDELDETREGPAGQIYAEASRKDEPAAQKQHEDERVDEWEEESFPASDPPENY